MRVRSLSGRESFTLNKFLILKVEKTSLMSTGLQNRLTSVRTLCCAIPENRPMQVYPEHVLNSIIHRYISKAVKGDNARPVAGVEPQESPKFYFKIPYIGRFSGIAQHRVSTLVNRFCKPVDIKLVFSTFKIKNLFNVKDSLPDRLRTRVVYKFSCASCNACYIGETSRHFATRVREHLSSDRSSHVFKHLQSSESCHISCSADCFTVLDSATTKFQVKLKESMKIKWEKPDLNQQVKHINLTLSL